MKTRILITGATGTLGRAVIAKLLSQYENHVIILGISRDEQKQRTMPKDPRLILRLADVRDINSLRDAITGMFDFDYIFHFASLKCVDSLEQNRDEAIRTNVIGTKNVVSLAEILASHLIFTSTDKAAYPINTYGMTKALAERLVLIRDQENTVCRYGNVLGSRGSMLESLKKSLIEKKTAYITDERMTRFWMTLNQARDFVIHCAFSDKMGLQIPFFIRSSTVMDLIDVTAEILEVKNYTVEKIGIRPGEKIHECLCTEYEPHHRKNFNSNDFDRLMTRGELKDLVEKALEL